jgi:16S rRNA (adenine1518-N6/adenine1519-N6)-dimethyltransferase
MNARLPFRKKREQMRCAECPTNEGNQELWKHTKGKSRQMTPLAKKRFGQHFLRDTGMLERIVRLIDPHSGDLLVEVGAGSAALSSRLAPAVSRLLAIEIDDECIGTLREALSWFPGAQVVHGNILQIDLPDMLEPYLAPGTRLRVTGNLPFNISTAIITKWLDSGLPIHDMVFMVQLEVAERLTATPGTRDYGYLSILCQHRADLRLEFRVSPACFVPRPKVVSAMVSMRPRPQEFAPELEHVFRELAKASFAHRRKTIANSLARDPRYVELGSELLRRADIDGRRRPEQLSVLEYERLAQTLAEVK